MYNRFRHLFIAALLLHAACSRQPAMTGAGKSYVLDDSGFTGIDSAVHLSADPYRSRLRETMSEVLCRSSMPMERGNPEGLLGNFTADVCLEEGNNALKTAGNDSLQADFVVLNNGGLRRSIPKGDITLGDLYEVMPFENRLILLSMTGEEVTELCNFIANRNGTPVSGIEIVLEQKDSSVSHIRIRGKSIEPGNRYLLLAPDYLVNGGDKFPFTRIGSVKKDIGITVRDALVNYCRKSGMKNEALRSVLDGRISYEAQ